MRRGCEGVQVSVAITAEENLASLQILDRKSPRVKFDRNKIVTSERSNENKILGNVLREKNIAQLKHGSRCRNRRMPKV